MINYGFTKELTIPFGEAVEVVTAALKKRRIRHIDDNRHTGEVQGKDRH